VSQNAANIAKRHADVPLISQRVHHNNTETLPGRVVRNISVHHNLGFSRLAQVPPEGWKVQKDDSQENSQLLPTSPV